MNFDFTDDQQVIKRTARDLLSERSKLSVARAATEGEGYDDAIWRELIELGWPGIAIDEEFGGQGLGTLELAILAEELGYALTPSPFLSNALAGLVIDHCGDDEQRRARLPGIADGSAAGTVGTVKDGSAAVVPDGATASVIVLVDDGGVRVVDSSEAQIEDAQTIDGTRPCSRVVASGSAGALLSEDGSPGVDRAALIVAAEIVGVCQRALDMTLEYVKEREQFGKPVGAFQAVSHRCAEMLLATESARAATYGAAWAADSAPEGLPVASSIAKAAASDAGRSVTAAAIQMHGGIGFTWEHDAHMLFKRAQLDAVLLGGASQHRDRVARLAGEARQAA